MEIIVPWLVFILVCLRMVFSVNHNVIFGAGNIEKKSNFLLFISAVNSQGRNLNDSWVKHFPFSITKYHLLLHRWAMVLQRAENAKIMKSFAPKYKST